MEMEKEKFEEPEVEFVELDDEVIMKDPGTSGK